MNFNNKLVTFSQQELVLSRTDVEREKIKNSLAHLIKVIKDSFGNKIFGVVVFGSYTRNTILPRYYDPKSDIDLLIFFDTTDRELTVGTYRKNLLDVMQNAYPNSYSQKDFPAVKLELNHIMFDLVPAIVTHHFFYGERTWIPSANDKWEQTIPNDINDSLTSQNQKYGNNTVRNVIRLCKYWNAVWGYPYYSYFLEKKIINLNFQGDDTYKGFLYAMKSIASEYAGVSQALDYIGLYENRGNEDKQAFWLKKLLPALDI
jgi:predicted nucleotidyltransferase